MITFTKDEIETNHETSRINQYIGWIDKWSPMLEIIKVTGVAKNVTNKTDQHLDIFSFGRYKDDSKNNRWMYRRLLAIQLDNECTWK